MDQKPTLRSTGDLLLFLSTASVSNSLLGAQASGTPGVLLQHSHPFPLPGKSLQDKDYESYFTDRETEAADKEAERKPAALSSNPYDSHWARHCHFLTSRRVLCMENQKCKQEALLTSPRREDAWILHCQTMVQPKDIQRKRPSAVFGRSLMKLMKPAISVILI